MCFAVLRPDRGAEVTEFTLFTDFMMRKLRNFRPEAGSGQVWTREARTWLSALRGYTSLRLVSGILSGWPGWGRLNQAESNWIKPNQTVAPVAGKLKLGLQQGGKRLVTSSPTGPICRFSGLIRPNPGIEKKMGVLFCGNSNSGPRIVLNPQRVAGGLAHELPKTLLQAARCELGQLALRFRHTVFLKRAVFGCVLPSSCLPFHLYWRCALLFKSR
jgi:hypothetical protein